MHNEAYPQPSHSETKTTDRQDKHNGLAWPEQSRYEVPIIVVGVALHVRIDPATFA